LLRCDESSARLPSDGDDGGVGKLPPELCRSGDTPAAGIEPAPNGDGEIDGAEGIDGAGGIDDAAGMDGLGGSDVAGADGEGGNGDDGGKDDAGNDDGGNFVPACPSDRPKPKSAVDEDGDGSPHVPNVPVAPPLAARGSVAGGVTRSPWRSPNGLGGDCCGVRVGGADFAPKICVYSPGFASGICAAAGVGGGAGGGAASGAAARGCEGIEGASIAGVDTGVNGFGGRADGGWFAAVGALPPRLPPILKMRVYSPGSGSAAFCAAGVATAGGVGCGGVGCGGVGAFTAGRTTVGAAELTGSGVGFDGATGD